MQRDIKIKHDKKQKENWILPLAILSFLFFSWLVYVYENRIWMAAVQRCISWLANPIINYTPIQIEGIPIAFLATIEMLLLGILATRTFIDDEKDKVIKFVSVFGLGAGFTALVTIILAIFGNLFQLPLNITILLLCIGFQIACFYRRKGKEKTSIRKLLKTKISFGNFKKPDNFRLWVLACCAIAIIFFFCFYHALQTVIVHWDSTVYHAVMPVIMYQNHGFPLIAGPSIGIEMSANFPPLFPALGAYYYIQMNLIEDVYLRVISPVMGILTVLATYKIGEIIAGKKYGMISALFLSITPLFFKYAVYATSYAILTFFGAVSVLFLFIAVKRGKTRYWIMCGIFYGFALLTSYMAAYLAPFLIVSLIGYFIKNKKGVTINMKIALLLFTSTLIISGVWYFRNLIVLGNPIYPNGYTLLGGINIDPLIMETTFGGIKRDAVAAFFGGDVSLLEKIFIFITYKTHFPSISLLTILGIAALPTLSKKFWLLSAWPIALSGVILIGITWSFPRHIVVTLPGFALVSAIPIMKAMEKIENYNRNIREHSKNVFVKTRNKIPLPKKSNFFTIGLVIFLVTTFLFPSLTFSMCGKVVLDNLKDEPLSNYLWFWENPNGEKWTALERLIPDSKSWKWLDENLKEGEKVATIENSIYYVKNCSNEYFFYLDGWEARHLYNITDPITIIQYLRSQNVKYFFDVPWAWEHGHLDILPMKQFLRPPYFIKVLDNNTYFHIYEVGPIETPITENTPIMISINQKGWSEPELVNGVLAQSVIAGSVLPRLYVDASDLTIVKITYLDAGTDMFSINFYNQYSATTVFDYAVIQKNNTNEWKTCEFLAPFSEEGYVELAFHAYNENFTISRIEAVPFQHPAKVPFNSLEREITSTTFPLTLMVYLPILYNNETVIVETNSSGREISIEIFEDIIQPWETAQWWEHHEIVARSPSMPVFGQTDPSLVWKTRKTEEPGLYTIIIMLREKYNLDVDVDVQLSIGGTK